MQAIIRIKVNQFISQSRRSIPWIQTSKTSTVFLARTCRPHKSRATSIYQACHLSNIAWNRRNRRSNLVLTSAATMIVASFNHKIHILKRRQTDRAWNSSKSKWTKTTHLPIHQRWGKRRALIDLLMHPWPAVQVNIRGILKTKRAHLQCTLRIHMLNLTPAQASYRLMTQFQMIILIKFKREMTTRIKNIWTIA